MGSSRIRSDGATGKGCSSSRRRKRLISGSRLVAGKRQSRRDLFSDVATRVGVRRLIALLSLAFLGAGFLRTGGAVNLDG